MKKNNMKYVKKKYIRYYVLTALMITMSLLSAKFYPRIIELRSPRMNGRDVELLQKYLIYNGYYVGNDGVDGWFGPASEKALRTYQKDLNGYSTGKFSFEKEPEMSLNFEILHSVSKPSGKKKSLATITMSRVKQENEKKLKLKTYFGDFSIYHVNRKPYDSLNLFLSAYEQEAKCISVFNSINVSPSGRFFLIEERDFYSGQGSEGFQIIDLISEQIFNVYYALIEESEKPNEMVFVYDTDFFWIDNKSLAFRFYWDYQKESGHPGHEKLNLLDSTEKMTNDPFSSGWYILRLTVNNNELLHDINYYIKGYAQHGGK